MNYFNKLTTAFLLLILLLFTSFCIAQNNCSTFYPLTEGTTFEYTNTNKKGKLEGVANYKVVAVTANGTTTNATFAISYADKKGKEVYATNYNFTCDGEVVKIDYKSLFPTQMMEQYKDMEMDITGTDIELPNNLTVGNTLPDANVAVTINMGGINMNITVDTTNRQVASKESIITPAGTFDCYVITENLNSKAMMMNQQYNNKVWLAEGVGMVQQEVYKTNGSLVSKTSLTKFEL